MEGIFQSEPKIKKISFPIRGRMALHLEDGRIIIIPINYFPSIKSLSLKQRSKWYIINHEGFSFDDCDEVFHIEQVLGKEQIYSHK